ncbi:MAG: hypothetical protein LBR85_09050 [Oscillospiraceae bacterium]|jgi:hypothetical protein|nr:hypothetical protein [Oscillospiraceae bacterium]
MSDFMRAAREKLLRDTARAVKGTARAARNVTESAVNQIQDEKNSVLPDINNARKKAAAVVHKRVKTAASAVRKARRDIKKGGRYGNARGGGGTVPKSANAYSGRMHQARRYAARAASNRASRAAAKRGAETAMSTIAKAVSINASGRLIMLGLGAAAVVLILVAEMVSLPIVGISGTGGEYASPLEGTTVADRQYNEWENALEADIRNIEAKKPGYDYYTYILNVGGTYYTPIDFALIDHSEEELNAYITAIMEETDHSVVINDGRLRALFDRQYSFSLQASEEEIDIMAMPPDVPPTAKPLDIWEMPPDLPPSNEPAQTEEPPEPLIVRTLTITLTVTPIRELVTTEEQRALFDETLLLLKDIRSEIANANASETEQP